MPSQPVGDPPCGPPGVLLDDGSCQQPGVPPEVCPDGFEVDLGGCVAVLAGPCEPGQMALPGEPTCRPVADCGDGPWGTIPVGPDTVYVDGSFGGVGAGTEAAPFTSVQEAVAAAAPNGIVAIAEGTYVEDITLDKTVQLWGRCPSLVELVGTGDQTVFIVEGASGSAVRSLAITGAGRGVRASGALDVQLDRVWIHDTAGRGVSVVNGFGPTSLEVVGSLVEATVGMGVYALGTEVTVRASEVRDVVEGPPGTEGSYELGFGVMSRVESNTLDPALVLVEGSTVRQNHYAGLFVHGGQLTVRDSAVHDTRATPNGQRGVGIFVQLDHEIWVRGTATVERTEVKGSIGAGVLVIGADATLRHTMVHQTVPIDDGSWGSALSVEEHAQDGNTERATVTAEACAFIDNHQTGAAAWGSDLNLVATLIRHVRPDQSWPSSGGGVFVMSGWLDPTAAGRLHVQRSHVDDVVSFGIAAIDAQVEVHQSLVSKVAPTAAGLYGDGIGAVRPTTTFLVANTEVRDASRVGIGSFDAATSVADSRLDCNVIDLSVDGAGQFADLGGNACGCGDQERQCQVRTIEQEVPEPIPH